MMPYRNLSFIDGRLVSSLLTSLSALAGSRFPCTAALFVISSVSKNALVSSPPFRKADAKIEVFLLSLQTNRNLFLEYFLVRCAKGWTSDMLHNIFFTKVLQGKGDKGVHRCGSKRSLLRWQSLLAPMGNAPRCVFGSSFGQHWQAVWYEPEKAVK